MSQLLYPPQANAIQKTLNTGLNQGVTASLTLNNATYIDNKPGVIVIDRIDTNGTEKSASEREYIEYTGVSGSTLTGLTRGVSNSTDQDHATGAVVEFIVDVTWGTRVTEALATVVTDADHQAVNTANIVTPGATQTITGAKTFSTAPLFTFGSEASGDIFYGGADGTLIRLPKGSDGQVLSLASGVPAWSSSSGGTSFWTDVPGTPTRVSDTQFTITDTSNANLYDQLFKKGVVFRWLESGTFQTAMGTSSSYGTNTVTINIVGDSLTAGFTSMKYAIQEAMRETFIIPGTIATGTDLAKTWYTPEQCYILSADAYHKTAGTTNSTVYDINDDGSTKFTTKPTITSTNTSDIDNVADNVSTAVAADSLITVDVDSVSTTAPVEAYIYLYWYPVSWRYR